MTRRAKVAAALGLAIGVIALAILACMYWPLDVPPVPGGVVRDGDVVLIRSRSLRGMVVRAFHLGRADSFTHVGVLTRIDGDLHLVHACPDAGRVLVEPLQDVLISARASGYAVYRPEVAAPCARAAVERALAYARARTPFDHEFDAQSADRIYCTELVLRAYLPDVARLQLPTLAETGEILYPALFARNGRFRVVSNWR